MLCFNKVSGHPIIVGIIYCNEYIDILITTHEIFNQKDASLHLSAWWRHSLWQGEHDSWTSDLWLLWTSSQGASIPPPWWHGWNGRTSFLWRVSFCLFSLIWYFLGDIILPCTIYIFYEWLGIHIYVIIYIGIVYKTVSGYTYIYWFWSHLGIWRGDFNSTKKWEFEYMLAFNSLWHMILGTLCFECIISGHFPWPMFVSTIDICFRNPQWESP